MRVFADMFKETLPKRRISDNMESLVFVKELSISLTVLKRVHLSTKQSPVKKNIYISFKIKVTQTKWIQSIFKTMFEFGLTQMT